MMIKNSKLLIQYSLSEGQQQLRICGTLMYTVIQTNVFTIIMLNVQLEQSVIINIQLKSNCFNSFFEIYGNNIEC